MLVTIVRGMSKGFWYEEGWVILRARIKVKDGKVMCQVGRKVLNRSFEYAAQAIRHCAKEMSIPEYRIIFGDDVLKDIEEQKQKELATISREERVKELADQFLPPAIELDNLKIRFPSVLEQKLLAYLSIIKSAETVYRKAVGNTLYWMEEDIKRFGKEN